MCYCDHRRAFPSFLAIFERQRDGMARAITHGVKRDDPNGIDERAFRFFCDVLRFVDTIPTSSKTSRIIEQLVDAAGSIGSNREEALGASSRREFIRYNEIALRSANESVKWLRACAVRRLGDPAQCVRLLDEARQIARIVAKIVITTKRNRGPDRHEPADDSDVRPET